MNEQNPPPYHLKRAEQFHRLQVAVLIGCLGILVYLLIALDTKNLLTLLLELIFMALPLTITFFAVDRRIKYWQSPYQLYSQEFLYKPKLKSGMQVPVQVEYHFPVAVNSPSVLERLNAAAETAINKAFSSLYTPGGYEETRKVIVDGLEEEIKTLDIEVFRVRVLKIDFPTSRQSFDNDPISVGRSV
jgi:hypothetical protein